MSTLYVIATPLGNLSDITYRAVETLGKVDFIACEDTRRTQVLLAHYDIKKPLVSYHQHTRVGKIGWLVERMVRGENGALVSDAGTPGIADPGGLLVKMAVEAGINVVPIPGPAAVTTLLSVTGWPTDEFLFLGYLPKKKGRQTLLNELTKEKRPIVIYESPERIEKTLEDLAHYLGDEVDVVIGRELTKIFEEIIRGSLGELRGVNKLTKKGEFTLCLKKR